MSVGIRDERRVIVLTVMGPQAGPAIVTAAMRDGRRMKPIDRLAVRGGKSQMKTRAGWTLAIRAMLDRQFVPAAGKAIADCLPRLPRPDIVPDPDVTERGQRGIVKCRRPFNIGNAERSMVQHWPTP